MAGTAALAIRDISVCCFTTTRTKSEYSSFNEYGCINPEMLTKALQALQWGRIFPKTLVVKFV